MLLTIPTSFTQGDRVAWTQRLQGYSSITDTLSCFIRGQSSLDLTATGNANFSDEWDFEINSTQSMALVQGRYKAQFVLFNPLGRNTLGEVDLVIKPSFENLNQLDVFRAK